MVVASAILTVLGCSDSNTSKENNPQERPISTESVASTPQKSLQQLYANATKNLFQYRQLSASLYGLEVDKVGHYYADQMEDYSAAKEKQLRDQLRAISKDISAFPSSGLSASDIENQQVMANITRYYAGHPDFNIGYIDVWMGLSPFIVNQINGPLIDIPRTLANDHKVSSLQDAQDYVERLGKFDQLLASVGQKLDADVASGWIAPKVTLQGAANFLSGFTKAKSEEHILIKEFAQKVNQIEALDNDQKQAIIAEAIAKLEEVVYPAYQGMEEKVKGLIDKARDESGIWAQPQGDKYYKDAILQLGDSQLSADQIHQIGLDEVARISQQMDSILVAQGYKAGSVGERMVKLGEEPRFLYADSDTGRKQLLSDLNGYINEITEKMKPLFKSVPPYSVEVRAFPVEIQDGAPGGQYSSPSVDGSKPGVYWINLRDMKANPKFSLKSLTYHEANPGHHWQVALNLAQDSLPFLRRMAPYNAYVEGWALYSEKVAEEMGMYESDPFGNLGRLQAELFRAVRLVVDTGLHHKRWTREQAIQYMAEQTGSAESDVKSEIERYMAWPGQALGYKLGMIKILALRENAQKALGDKFDLAEFHDLVLLGGAVPMAVLEAKVQSWVKQVELRTQS